MSGKRRKECQGWYNGRPLPHNDNDDHRNWFSFLGCLWIRCSRPLEQRLMFDWRHDPRLDDTWHLHTQGTRNRNKIVMQSSQLNMEHSFKYRKSHRACQQKINRDTELKSYRTFKQSRVPLNPLPFHLGFCTISSFLNWETTKTKNLIDGTNET